MDDFEQKLNSILGNPSEMEKIMSMARELSGSAKPSDKPDQQPAASGPLPSLDALDPKMLGMLSRLMSEYNRQDSGKHALLQAMKPYLRQERQEALDRAAQITRLARIARMAFSEWDGEKNV